MEKCVVSRYWYNHVQNEKNQWFYVVFRQRMIIGALTFATLDKK